jgi:hypothetical protein
MGSETQSLTWKSPDEKETYFTWVVPSGSAERRVRTILVKTSSLEALKSQRNAYLISNAGVLLSLPHTTENLTKTERLYRLTQRLTQQPLQPVANEPFVSSTEDGSDLIVAVQNIPAIGSKLALESSWRPGTVKASADMVSQMVPILAAAFVFGFLFWFFRRPVRTYSNSHESILLQAHALTTPQMKMAKAKAALDEAVREAEEKAAAMRAEKPVAAPVVTPPIQEVKIATKDIMDPRAQETLRSLDDAVSDFDWSKLSQEISLAELKPVTQSQPPNHET